MNGKYLLDTNIIIALFADDPAVTKRLVEFGEVFASSVAIGELCFGARKSRQAEHNLARVEEFAASCTVLGCSTETARRYGELKNSLRLKGRLLPENDIWIAAIALEHGLTLVSRDAHFTEIEDFPVAVW